MRAQNPYARHSVTRLEILQKTPKKAVEELNYSRNSNINFSFIFGVVFFIFIRCHTFIKSCSTSHINEKHFRHVEGSRLNLVHMVEVVECSKFHTKNTINREGRASRYVLDCIV
jgi:hypothetical protein